VRILIKTPLTPYTGYGNDGIGLATALHNYGADVYLQPTSVQAPLPPLIAYLLTKQLRAPFDMTIHHLDPGTLEALPEEKANTEVTIAWSMWEYSNLKNLDGRSSLKKRMAGYDAFVGYDKVTNECFRDYYKGTIIQQQGGYNADDWKPVDRNWHSETFNFFMLGVLNTRKDPFVAVQAYAELKREHPEEFEPARLTLKTTAPGLHSKMEEVYPGLKIEYAMWSTETVQKFYASQHVLLAPSRGEGKNMPALEFQSTGGAVIATNWAGHTGWLHPAYSYPLDYTLAPVDFEHPNTLNARASVEHLKELMLHAIRNRAEVEAKGNLASQIIPRSHDWSNVVEGLFQRLKDAGVGSERLWAEALLAKAEAPSVRA
jgi:glycosyltransferase involved in cell wall biosynthesis